MSDNKNLRNANRVKDDEFYTPIGEIIQELNRPDYIKNFKDKIIYCNCDNPKKSKFYDFFKANFFNFGIKKLIFSFFGEHSYFLEYSGENETITPFTSGNGDFRSPECVKLLQEADIIVTNPPFSLFRDFISLIMKYNKKFVVIGNLNAISYKEFFPYLKEKKIWAGYGFDKSIVFEVGDKSQYDEVLSARIADGRHYKSITISWYTNLDIDRKNIELKLDKKYYGNEANYPKYDYCDVINVKRLADIPNDYNGIMGVPVTFIGSWNSNQFDVIDLLNRYSIYDSQGINDFIKKNHLHSCNIKDKSTYARILIRKI